jgi:hypothetical protein
MSKLIVGLVLVVLLSLATVAPAFAAEPGDPGPIEFENLLKIVQERLKALPANEEAIAAIEVVREIVGGD